MAWVTMPLRRERAFIRQAFIETLSRVPFDGVS